MIQTLNDRELLTKTSIAVNEEKKATSIVLEYLQEVEKRKVYADLGYSSLYNYCIKELRYSEAEASIRVNATRLTSFVPATKKMIDSGELSLTNASQLRSFIRNEKTNKVEALILTDKIKNTSTRQAKEILNSLAKNPVVTKNIKLNERILKKLSKIQNEFDNCSELEAIEALLDEKLESINHSKPKRKSNTISKNQRYIPRYVGEKVDLRAKNQCEYMSTITGKRCSCRTNLQYEHIRPIAIGGQSTFSNMQKLCPTHNRRQAIKSFGNSLGK